MAVAQTRRLSGYGDAPLARRSEGEDLNNRASNERSPLLPNSTSHPHDTTTSNLGENRENRASTRRTEDGDFGPQPDLTTLRIACIAFSLWLLIFLQASNMSGITMIQGSIAGDLDAYEGTMWFTSGYLIAMSSLAPLIGKLAAVFSPRALILPIAALVALGAAISAAASTLPVFILGRVVMGGGGAGVLTLAIILVLELSSKKRRGLVMGIVNASFSLGVSSGGIVYGALLPVVGWRVLFWIQTPIAAIAGVGLFLSLPTREQHADKASSVSTWQQLKRIDYLGAFMLILTIFFFLYGLVGQIEPLYLLISFLCLVAFVAVENLLAVDPVIPLKVLRSRSVLLSCASQLGLMSARWTVLYYMPIFMLAVCGAPRAAAGSVLIPTNVGFALGGMIVGWLHIHRSGSFWLPCLVAIGVFSLSMWALSMVAHENVSLVALVVTVLAGGFATGAAVNYTLAHVLHHSHDGTQYITTSLIGTFRGFGGAFGTSIGGGIFSRILQTSLIAGFQSVDGDVQLSPERKRLISRLLGAPELVYGGGLNATDQKIAMDAYSGASKGVWQAAAALGLIVMALQAGTGWKGPRKVEEGEIDETEARANVLENEGVEEA